METEALIDYIGRLLKCDKMYHRTDHGVYEFIPHEMAKINALIKTYDHTYYFSISSSLRGTRIKNKAKEFLDEPKKSVSLGLGFDPEV
jgi:hypothetical protein